MRGVVFETVFDIGLTRLYSKVLVLNRFYLPIHITSVKRAVNLLFLESAVGIDDDYQTYRWEDLVDNSLPQGKRDHFHLLRTVSMEFPVPKVLLLLDYEKRPPQGIRFSRAQVFLRDRHTCQYCSQTLPKHRLNIDHVVPRSQGGKTTWENVVTSCHPCNRRKGGRTPVQANMRLLTKPHRPAVSPTLSMLKQSNPTWTPFLFTTE